MNAEKGWLARDMSGALYFYESGKKPRKYAGLDGKMSLWYVANYKPIWIKNGLDIFRNVKWEDERPTEITITIN